MGLFYTSGLLASFFCYYLPSRYQSFIGPTLALQWQMALTLHPLIQSLTTGSLFAQRYELNISYKTQTTSIPVNKELGHVML